MQIPARRRECRETRTSAFTVKTTGGRKSDSQGGGQGENTRWSVFGRDWGRSPLSCNRDRCAGFRQSRNYEADGGLRGSRPYKIPHALGGAISRDGFRLRTATMRRLMCRHRRRHLRAGEAVSPEHRGNGEDSHQRTGNRAHQTPLYENPDGSCNRDFTPYSFRVADTVSKGSEWSEAVFRRTYSHDRFPVKSHSRQVGETRAWLGIRPPHGRKSSRRFASQCHPSESQGIRDHGHRTERHRRAGDHGAQHDTEVWI